MNLKTTLLICTLLATAWANSTTTSLAEILTFDDLPTPASGGESPIPGGYGNLGWSGFNYLNGLIQVPSGYNNAVVSLSNVAFNAYGGAAQINGQAFNLNSAYLTAAWNNGLQVDVQGFVGNTLTYNNIYTVNTTGPTLIDFNYVGVDEVIFTSSGGTHNPSYTQGQGFEFAMDNVNITFVPEPSAFALGSLAGVTLLVFCRQKRNQRLA